MILFPAVCFIFFVLVGFAFLPRLGIEDDEALFGVVFYEPSSSSYVYHLGHLKLPFMMLPYLGTLKSYLYTPVFALLGISLRALRVPALLAGGASLWLLFRLLLRLVGERAAVIGCGLLAVDAMYLLTSVFDWGPVALQHLLLLGGLLLLVRFWQERREPALAAGFFLFGLAMWDKALAVWSLSGFAVAALVTIPRQMFSILAARRLAVAVLAFAIGALPLILYNVHTRGGTFAGNAVYDAGDLPGKARQLLNTFQGNGLYGWMVEFNTHTNHPHAPRGFWQATSAELSSATGHPEKNLLFYAFCLALLLTPLARGAALRTILFATIAMAVAWCQMIFTARAGGAVHHTILLWPLPQIIMGASFAEASRRLGRVGLPLVTAVVVVVVASSLAVINENYARVVRNGGAPAWSDAIFPLSTYLQHTGARYVFCVDWGFLDTLRLLSNGRLPARVGLEQVIKPQLSPEDRDQLRAMISEPANVFVTHTRGFEFFPGLSAKLIHFAEDAGYRREMLTVISDSHDRPTFEVYRFAAAANRP